MLEPHEAAAGGATAGLESELAALRARRDMLRQKLRDAESAAEKARADRRRLGGERADLKAAAAADCGVLEAEGVASAIADALDEISHRIEDGDRRLAEERGRREREEAEASAAAAAEALRVAAINFHKVAQSFVQALEAATSIPEAVGVAALVRNTAKEALMAARAVSGQLARNVALPGARGEFLDYADLVDRGGKGRTGADGIEPIVILVPSRSHTRVIASGFATLYPDLANRYVFLDFEDLPPADRPAQMGNAVRAFARAALPARMIALFDNDTSGHAALASLSDVALSASIRAMTLPPAETGRRYPTVSPQGGIAMDVNGLACGIEIYLGRAALSRPGGELRPVLWTGFDPRLKRYQGEVEGKSDVIEQFMALLRSCSRPDEARARFSDLARLLTVVAAAFEPD